MHDGNVTQDCAPASPPALALCCLAEAAPMKRYDERGQLIEECIGCTKCRRKAVVVQ